ncbi:response regulator [Hymenobacter sp. GOD-10R]|uniref:response regulator n=1 Tax=Hymenobacter sp. GOD-10R TaxID=3093922 RepID=UPI002D7A3A04|nr:response regulator [Hymenobacter sp. GOD-10R]WRQ27013.1 response regulator [Hymenobacter sp. GOD-10R]
MFDLIYVIEDDPITLVITELIVKQNKAFGEVQKYVNGQEAYDTLLALQRQEEVPDLILLDLNMPVMDGWEFLDAFSALQLPKEVCVCVLTSSIHPEDIEKSRGYKAVKGYFTKPLDGDALEKMLGLANESKA